MEKIKLIIHQKFNKFPKRKTITKNIYIIIVIVTFSLLYYLFPKDSQYIIIEVDISLSKFKGGGPIQFSKGLANVLPYKTKNCLFIPSPHISYRNKKKNSNYLYISAPHFTEKSFNEWKKNNYSNALLLGPNMVPIYWDSFPNLTFWEEKNFNSILKNIKGYIVHSERVRNYLSSRSNTINMLNKYIIMRPCSYVMPKLIKPFDNRQIDIIFFEKFADFNRRKQAEQLVKLFIDNNKKLIRLKYGNYTKKKLFEISNNSKFIVYFSFYDTGAIGLKEIQNYGVFAFTLQKDLAIHEKTSLYIPELENIDDMKPSFTKIIHNMNIISESNPNTQLIAKINQEINRCERALDDLCKGIVF